MGDDKWATGKKETFEIGENERLIGCELDYGDTHLLGITFIKWSL